MKRIALVGLILFASACASRPFIVNTGAPLSFEHLKIDSEVKTSDDGDVIFEGIPHAKRTATLLEPVEQDVPVRKQALHYITAGSQLYFLKTKGNPAPTYCTISETFEGMAPIGRVAGRSCLTDLDGDLVFDSVWVGAITTSPMLIVGANYASPNIIPTMIQDRTDLTVPIPYVLGVENPIEGDSVGIVYEAVGKSSARIRKFTKVNGQSMEFADGVSGGLMTTLNRRENTIIFSDKDLPANIDFVGVNIDFLSIEEGRLEYRVNGISKSDEPYTAYQAFPCAANIAQGKLCEFKPFD